MGRVEDLPPSEQHCSPAEGLKHEFPLQTTLPAPKQAAQLEPEQKPSSLWRPRRWLFGVVPTSCFVQPSASTRDVAAARKRIWESEKRMARVNARTKGGIRRLCSTVKSLTTKTLL